MHSTKPFVQRCNVFAVTGSYNGMGMEIQMVLRASGLLEHTGSLLGKLFPLYTLEEIQSHSIHN
jgi:hypothetical protein